MNILVATSDFFEDVENLFHGHQVELLPQKYENMSVDLVVFTGGEDILPSRYKEPDPSYGWFNPDRDEWEFKVLNSIFSGQLSTKKVLGICRGHQLLNVFFGGTLIYDIFNSYGISHKNVHPLRWRRKSPLQEIFSEVNSLHHQGIAGFGKRLPVMNLATEPTTEMSEVVVWDDRFLGVQFHPEFMDRHPRISEFKEIIHRWVLGEPIYENPTTFTINSNDE